MNKNTIVDFAKTLFNQGDAVTKLKVKGEDPTTGMKDEVINLLNHKIKRQYSADELKVVDHRYTIQSRWDLLDRALRGWI